MSKSYIKKIKLSYIEGWINKRLKRNVISIGFDVSTYSTGIAILRTTDTYLILEQTHIIKVPKLAKFATTKQMLDNINLFLSQLEDFKKEVSKKHTLNINRIEDCFLRRNVKTLKALARYGILVYGKFRDISKDIDLIMPISARKKIGFKKSSKLVKGTYLKKEIINYINMLLGTKIEKDDIADGIVLALGGLIEEGE